MLNGNEIFRQADARMARYYTQVRQKESAQRQEIWDTWISLVRDIDQLGVLDGIAHATGQGIRLVPYGNIETVSYPPNVFGHKRLMVSVQTPDIYGQVTDEILRIRIFGTDNSPQPVETITYKRGTGVAVGEKLVVDPEEHRGRKDVAELTRRTLETILSGTSNRADFPIA